MLQIKENYSLKYLNTFKIDQKSNFFVEIKNLDELLELLKNPQWKTIPKLFLGGGSNMLLCKDFEGLVVKINLKGIRFSTENDIIVVSAAAGEVWHDFVMYCVDNEWAGLENLSLIPGSVGAAPIQNIGAYGVEVKDKIRYVKALNINTLNIEIFSNSECKFGYRESVFKNEFKNKYIILEVGFSLTKTSAINSSYGAIKETLEKNGISNPTIKDISNAVIEIRKSKLPDPNEIGNAGSFFKNPEVEYTVFEQIKLIYPEVPSYPAANNLVKIPAGWLIEKAGWKGKTIGDCGVHKNQALVLVNYGSAKGLEIKLLAENIQNDIFNIFGIYLQNEVNYI
ncbi:MAG: UDP-N-acetylmuramate dehydrogenase [Cytophagales bacterium]